MMRTAAAFVTAAAAGLGVVAVAHAADIRIDLKIAEITVTLEETVKTHPRLAKNLLAEGRRWAERQRKETLAERKSDPSLFRGDRPPWAFERTYAADAVAGRTISVVRTDYTYTGGAHPNTQIDTILWDDGAGKRISIRPFFMETADNGPAMTALLALVRKGIDAEKAERFKGLDFKPEPFTGLEPRLLGIGPVSLAPSTEKGKAGGLTFNYEPYAVGAYAEGTYIITVPWRSFASHLSDEGRALFGGEVKRTP